MLLQRRMIYVFLWLGAISFGLLAMLSKTEMMVALGVSLSAAFFMISALSLNNVFLARAVEFIYTLMLGAQVASVWNTGRYVEVLTLANLGETASVSSAVLCKTAAVFVLWVMVPLFIYSRLKVRVSFNALWLLVPCGAVVFGFFKEEPVSSFAEVALSLGKQVCFKENLVLKEQQRQLYGKETIYLDEGNEVPDLSGKNVVVFFAEGLSLEVVDGFSRYEGLTPNIAQMMKKSLWFDNYFNHTAATYRGLRGQLSSSYQYMGGVQQNGALDSGFGRMNERAIQKSVADTVVSLPTILKQHGYHAYFLSGDGRLLNTYLAFLGFDKIFSAKDYLQDEEHLTDQQLGQYLQHLLTSGELEEPFVLGVYNIGTHNGMQSPDKKYLLDGRDDNDVLNTFHNYDDALGKVVDFIETQPALAEKTALVLTTDHATYSADSYIQTFNDERWCFLSRIPFVVYHQGIEPQRIDAGGRNSLDMAPTLLHLLRINSGHNYFLGCSLFNQTCAYPFHYAYNDGDTFLSSRNGAQIKCEPLAEQEVIEQIRAFYHLSDNRLLR